MEPENDAALTDYLSREGLTVLGNLAYQSVHKTAEGRAALTVLRDGRAETIIAERLLLATGRAPNVGGLGLNEAGVKQDRKSVVYGKSVSVRVELGCRRINKKRKKN